MTPDLRRGDVEPILKAPKVNKPKWGKRVKVVSDKRAEAKPWTDAIRERVFDRDGGCVVAGEPWCPDGEPHVCSGVPMTPHHRRKSGDQGAYSMLNLITLCSTANGQVEQYHDWIREHYPWLEVRRGDAEWESLGRKR